MMTRKSVSRRVETRKDGRDGRDGTQNAIRSAILVGLPPDERNRVLSKAELVDLPVHTVLHEAGVPIRYAYFLESGLSSFLNVMADGKSVEVGLSGSEGFVGLPLAAGWKTSPIQTVMQVGGSGRRIGAKEFEELLPSCPHLQNSLNRHAQVMGMQAAIVAACNRLHEVEERLARWLLMSQDRMGGSELPLTQDYLAHMLGTRRASVTVAAGILQKAGLIHYSRGTATIVDRSRLEEAACECYGAIQRQTAAWQKEGQL
jgi:CRP-like cAMP-binding protein